MEDKKPDDGKPKYQLKFPERNSKGAFFPVSEKRNKFIQGCLSIDPSTRIGANLIADVKAHPWFEKTDWKAAVRKELKPEFVPDPKEHNFSQAAELMDQFDVASREMKYVARKDRKEANAFQKATGMKERKVQISDWPLEYIDRYWTPYSCEKPTENKIDEKDLPEYGKFQEMFKIEVNGGPKAGTVLEKKTSQPELGEKKTSQAELGEKKTSQTALDSNAKPAKKPVDDDDD